MNLHVRFAQALNRISAATSVARTRSEDAVRAENHDDLPDRLEAVVERFEKIADDMEKALS